ncbi:MAG TPA: hypothetical protein VJ719_14375, partial [Chthoniobacterales bacterium]|nr:hypothetical protein [Chthoniobacterales bacterium]
RPHVPLADRLLILRAADQFRHWGSLDDHRVCVMCETEFTGRQVGITRTRSGHYRLHCPTEECNAGPRQWVYPGNPLTSDAAYQDWQRALFAPETSAAA